MILLADGTATVHLSAAWITAATAFAAMAGGLLVFAGRWAHRILSRTRDFLDDWAGEPERPGVAARPGVMTRLQTAETLIARVLAETLPNGGTSLRDVVHRAAGDAAGARADLAVLARRIEQLEQQRENREGTT